jgi:hypothetical protein
MTETGKQERQKVWPLRKGETVLFQEQEYAVVSPGSLGLNAELRSTRSPDVMVFVDAAEFEMEAEPETPAGTR